MEVILQVLSLSAVNRLARDSNAWLALAPFADTTHILSSRVYHENIGPFIAMIRHAVKLPGDESERLQIGIFINPDQYVGIFRIQFLCCQ